VIGFLNGGSPGHYAPSVAAFRQGLKETGYVEGQTVATPELFANERIFAVTSGSSSPGRIKELTRQFNGSWQTRDIDGTFVTDLYFKTIPLCCD
jgi:hypothetical protein